jgi:hypothetical protein
MPVATPVAGEGEMEPGVLPGGPRYSGHWSVESLIGGPVKTAVILGVIVVALIVGTMLSLRSSARSGMPSRDVLERAARRARELESRDE